EGGRPAAAAAEGDDRVGRGREPLADHVEPFHGRRGHEATGDAGAWRDGQLTPFGLGCHARSLLLAPRTRSSARRGPAGRGARWCSRTSTVTGGTKTCARSDGSGLQW